MLRILKKLLLNKNQIKPTFLLKIHRKLFNNLMKINRNKKESKRGKRKYNKFEMMKLKKLKLMNKKMRNFRPNHLEK